LHPIAWWVWATALGAAALRTTNVLLLGLLIAAAWVVVAARRPNAPWARSFTTFLRFGVAVVVLRMLLGIFFTVRVPGQVLFTLPQLTLPSWAAGVAIGGPVTKESLVLSFQRGLQLATLLVCVGAANSLASPFRLLRAVPSVLYELGVVVTVALSFAPQTVTTAASIRDARRLRGRPHRGLRSIRGLAVPVLEGALDRSLDLAASMDSRGYGRRGEVASARLRAGQAATLAGTISIAVGLFGVLDAGAPRILGLPMIAVGSVVLAASMRASRATNARSRYRGDPWRVPEWITVLSGVIVVVCMVVAGRVDPQALRPPYSPLQSPALPILPLLGILNATLPAFLTPPLPEEVT
jgi:energy-coupling factor transport system permease protein